MVTAVADPRNLPLLTETIVCRHVHFGRLTRLAWYEAVVKPASRNSIVTVTAGRASGSFNIGTSVIPVLGCGVFTITFDAARGRTLLKVFHISG